MLVIMASAALGWIFSMEHAGIAVANFVTTLTENKYMFLLIINILLLTLGMFLEGNAILLIWFRCLNLSWRILVSIQYISVSL